jgi:hypothetical protein
MPGLQVGLTFTPQPAGASRQFIKFSPRYFFTTMNKTLTEIAAIIETVDGVLSVNIWEKNSKARIYINLEKYNGGKNWNNGKAGTVWFENGRVYAKGDWAGAATRSASCRTIQKIELALADEITSSYVPEKLSDRMAIA